MRKENLTYYPVEQKIYKKMEYHDHNKKVYDLETERELEITEIQKYKT